jgi:threonyl-tRNA synthetase
MAEQVDHVQHKRHSLAHILAMAVREVDPDVVLGIGPATNEGFYYDFSFSRSDLNMAELLPRLEERMRTLVQENIAFEKRDASLDEVLGHFSNTQPYKVELARELADADESLSLVTSGSFTDLCKGGHVATTSAIDPNSFCLDRVAGAYWRGNEENEMLTRIYGLAFETAEELTQFKQQREEAAARDHKKLGKELDLFYIDESVGKGLPMWTPKGTVIKHELETLTRELERKYGYWHVETPYLGSSALYEQSGHLAHYSDNMYAPIDMDGEVFYLRPMACPHHVKLLQRAPMTYRDLPVRYAEIADYNRFEQSGELMGMIRVRKFQLTDAHLFTTPEQLKDEFKQVCHLIEEGMQTLGLSEIVSYRFSKRDPDNPEKYHPDDALWNHAEETMKEALEEIGFTYTEAEDEAAFYGPKLDVQATNVNGKEDTLFTAQIDFLLPEKFDITYTDSDGHAKRPVMIHRSAIGALERTFAFLIEHYAGKFPTWLAPIQLKLLPINEQHHTFAHELARSLRTHDVRIEVDDTDETLGKKIRRSKTERVPYHVVIGESEVSSKRVTLEGRSQSYENLDTNALIEHLTDEIRRRT